MISKPKPEDYPDRPNAYVRDVQRWQAMQPLPPIVPLPPELERLFTPESVVQAKAEAARQQRVCDEWNGASE